MNIVDGKRVDAKRQHLKTRDGDDKLFCGGVPSDFTDGQLAEFFSSYGMVDAVERPRDMVTGLAKGFAFITFKDPGIVDMIVGQRYRRRFFNKFKFRNFQFDLKENFVNN